MLIESINKVNEEDKYLIIIAKKKKNVSTKFLHINIIFIISKDT